MGYAGKPDLSTPAVPPPPVAAPAGKGATGAVDSVLDWMNNNSMLTAADRALRAVTGDALYPVEKMYKERERKWKAGDERLIKRYGPYPEDPMVRGSEAIGRAIPEDEETK